jgi:uncharacterized membrane protein YhiD involved in acid resistance
MAGVHLSWTHFLLRLSCAVICGIAIGAERQWRQRIAGLRTYSLVCLGAALFVLLGPFAGEETDIIKLKGKFRSFLLTSFQNFLAPRKSQARWR